MCGYIPWTWVGHGAEFLSPLDGSVNFQYKQQQNKKKKTKQNKQTQNISVQVSAHQQETACVHPH